MYDSYPNYKPAGITTPYTGESAGNCIQPSRQNLSTPEQIARFRKSYKNQAGKTITHYGKLYDPLPKQNFTYGKKTPASDHIPHVLRDEALEGLQGYVRNLKEAQYASNKKEPLGHPVNRSYQWPQTTQNKGFSFGVATLASESAKDVLYSHPSVYEDDLTRELYIKSHSLFEAGEQKKRPYKWPFDPKHHVFGRSGKMVINEAKMCLQPEVAEENYPKTVILKKNVEDFKDFSSYPVGSPKNLGQQRVQSLGPNHVFGFKPKNQEFWSAGKCIHGEPTFYEVQPDADLGKSTRFGFRNTPHAGDESRTFGIPTIRNDIQKPLHKSVSDQFNYGDEPDAFKLLNPERFHEMGVSRQDFEALRPKEEIKKLFANIGYAYKPGKFEGIFMRAQDLCRTQDDYVSINAFKQAIQELDHLE